MGLSSVSSYVGSSSECVSRSAHAGARACGWRSDKWALGEGTCKGGGLLRCVSSDCQQRAFQAQRRSLVPAPRAGDGKGFGMVIDPCAGDYM